MRNGGHHKARGVLVATPIRTICRLRSACGGDNALWHRVTPRDFKNLASLYGARSGARGLRWKGAMQTVIIVVHLMIVAVLIGAVLLQKSEGGGLGMGGATGFMSSRGTANLLTRTTAVLAFLFFLTSLSLNWLASYDRRPATIIGGQPPGQSQPAGGA